MYRNSSAIAEEFFFLQRYILRPFTDTNSVICIIIVGYMPPSDEGGVTQ